MSGDFIWLAAIMARNKDPDARVLVFIDGQNAYKACERLYKHGPCHPILLAERLAQGRKLVGVRYYSGVHDPTIDPDGRSRTDRRHNLIRRTGVTVVERQLRYRTEWGFDPKVLPDPRKSFGQTLQVGVTPYQRAREKGIDLAIGLDVIDLALNGHMDVVIIVSSDNDLCEAARSTHNATSARGRAGGRAGQRRGRHLQRAPPPYPSTALRLHASGPVRRFRCRTRQFRLQESRAESDGGLVREHLHESSGGLYRW